MAVLELASSVIGADCQICGDEPASVISTLTDPLVVSVTTRVCPSCYQLNLRAALSLIEASPRLVLKERAA